MLQCSSVIRAFPALRARICRKPRCKAIARVHESAVDCGPGAPKLRPGLNNLPFKGTFMAENPQRPISTVRPLSPHLTIYRWPVTMMTSITHRATGMGLSIGAVILAWWLGSISNGPEGWQNFHAIMDTPAGLPVLFGLSRSLIDHFPNDVRDLASCLEHG